MKSFIILYLYLQFIDTAMSVYMMANIDVHTTRCKLGMKMAFIQMTQMS